MLRVELRKPRNAAGDNDPASSANIARMYGHRLLRKTRRPVAILALVTLLLAQLAAGSHAARHLRDRYSPDVPGVHNQLCLECASFAPLASAHGGTVTALTVASLGIAEFIAAPERILPTGRRHVAFRSRAPPR